ncbi:MAG: hypothetical protein RPR40_11645 [Bermanella sp.]
MHLELLIAVLGWCAVINLALLLLWAIFIMLAADVTVSLQQRFVDLDKSSILKYNYLLMGFFKLSTLMFFVVPWAVLHLLS